MKILKLNPTNFKNCANNFEINFVPVARKTAEDKEYELQEIAEGLYVFSTMAVVGKNASGKTSALEVLELCYDILNDFRVSPKSFRLNGVHITMFFYHEGYIYRYSTGLIEEGLTGHINFDDQELLGKKYYKTGINAIFDFDGSELVRFEGELPEDTSNLFFVL